MNEETKSNDSNVAGNRPITQPDGAAPTAEGPARSRARSVIIVAVITVGLIAGLIVWFLWPARTGQPVPAPRSVSFAETSTPPPSTGDQRLILTPEQAQRAGLKIETVGEQPLAQADSQMTTGTVQANTYKETPVISLVGGIVRSVSGELGQGLKRGQKVAVVSSNELAEVESRYVAAVAALDEHHRHHLRTAKLVEIGAASRQELEMATRNTAKRKQPSPTCAKNSRCLAFPLSASTVLIRPRKSVPRLR